MPEDLAPLREEIAALRAELKELRLEHRKLLRMVGILPLREGEPWPEYLHVEAECVAVRKEKMHIPIIMRADDDCASLVFMDKNNRTRIELSLGQNGPQFEMRNAEGKLIFQLAKAPDGSGQLCACDAEGRPRAGMRVNEYGGVVNVVDKVNKPQACLLGTAEGGEIFAVNAMHQAAATMKATARGGLVTVSESSGQLMGFLGADADKGQLSVYGPHGAQAVGIGATEAGGGIVFYDVDGAAKASLP
jgi:hypothetical protein